MTSLSRFLSLLWIQMSCAGLQQGSCSYHQQPGSPVELETKAKRRFAKISQLWNNGNGNFTYTYRGAI